MTTRAQEEAQLVTIAQELQVAQQLVEKLTDARNTQMRACWQAGMSKAEIARICGVRREAAHYAILRAATRTEAHA